jgi:hypothetical protein
VLRSSGELSASGAAAAMLFYKIDPATDRIEIRKERLGELLEQRQYAAFDEERLLALMPDEATRYRLFVVRRDTSEAQRVTAIPSPTVYPDLVPLYQELAWRYGLTRDTPPDADAK